MYEIILKEKVYNILLKALKEKAENAESLYAHILDSTIKEEQMFHITGGEDFFLDLDKVAARLMLDYGVSYSGEEGYLNELGIAMENVIDNIVAEM